MTALREASVTAAPGAPGAPAARPARGSGAEGVGVRVEGISKRFAVRRSLGEALRAPRARRWVQSLDDVSFDVRPGEFFGLLGPNGAGKTTLFKMLATLVHPDAGRIVVGEDDVVTSPAAVRRVLAPVIADERSLQWRLDAVGNLELFAGLNGLRGGEAAARIRELLQVVGLEESARRQVGTYSSGMRQRLLIARALLARPRVVLLDEPTRSLDPIAARELRAFLRDEICGRWGCTVLLATHTAEEVRELCARVAILHRGRVRAVGAVDTIAAAVAEQRVAVWTPTPGHAAFARLAATGIARPVAGARAEREGEWERVELVVPGGHGETAAVLGMLVADGVEVSRLEVLPLPLADLIERVASRAEGR